MRVRRVVALTATASVLAGCAADGRPATRTDPAGTTDDDSGAAGYGFTTVAGDVAAP